MPKVQDPILESPKVAERFWAKFRKTEGCWEWRGSKARDGYGIFWHKGRQLSAHRLVYTLTSGPIPPGLTLDHLCRNTGCVNPSHLEPVSMRENTLRGTTGPAQNARKTQCQYGHSFDLFNTYYWHQHRICRMCRRLRRQAKE